MPARTFLNFGLYVLLFQYVVLDCNQALEEQINPSLQKAFYLISRADHKTSLASRIVTQALHFRAVKLSSNCTHEHIH